MNLPILEAYFLKILLDRRSAQVGGRGCFGELNSDINQSVNLTNIGLEIQEILRDVNDETRNFVQWIEGIHDALNKHYVRTYHYYSLVSFDKWYLLSKATPRIFVPSLKHGHVGRVFVKQGTLLTILVSFAYSNGETEVTFSQPNGQQCKFKYALSFSLIYQLTCVVQLHFWRDRPQSKQDLADSTQQMMDTLMMMQKELADLPGGMIYICCNY